MQKLFNALGRMGTMFVSKASQMPETTPPQRKLALEAIGLHFQNYPHYYSEYLAYRKMIWEKTKTGAITLRDIGEILKNGILAVAFFSIGQVIGRRNLLGYKGSEIENSSEEHGTEHKHGSEHKGTH